LPNAWRSYEFVNL